ncbi:MAG TPA: hypothetical protein VE172_16925 [Stackebrandtia sp.]|jgi:hypothetical protein|uniref:hypothetical protein n=1 Tax=Stackebrandtia sp. TaxID=2023065 RepID=UPI002D3FD5A6|nr:hypothetical protein [Stackebrandtia sp.]HZE40487.1 hypothetical protein [Stackebrandtia sp.]
MSDDDMNIDFDGDGHFDHDYETEHLDDGTTAYVHHDDDGNVDAVAYDTDHDGYIDEMDTDENGDGTLDHHMTDTTGDGYMDTDEAEDGPSHDITDDSSSTDDSAPADDTEHADGNGPIGDNLGTFDASDAHDDGLGYLDEHVTR